jgi:hypothetical protein
MKPITTFMHGVLDYPMATILMLSPYLFGFSHLRGAAIMIPIAIGFVALLQTLFTDNETGVVHAIPMSTHNTNDVIAGAFLALSPWLFGFSAAVYLPHLLFGLAMVAAGLLTQSIPSYRGRIHAGHI